MAASRFSPAKPKVVPTLWNDVLGGLEGGEEVGAAGAATALAILAVALVGADGGV